MAYFTFVLLFVKFSLKCPPFSAHVSGNPTVREYWSQEGQTKSGPFSNPVKNGSKTSKFDSTEST
jgi:hypothetical protein